MLDYKDIADDLAVDIVRNLYVFSGPEREIMRRYIRRIDPNAKEAESFKSLIIRFQNRGLFTESEVGTFVIREDKDVLDMDVDDILRAIGSNTVILIYAELDGRSKFVKHADSHIYEFLRMETDELAKHIQTLVRIDYKLAARLANMCSNDLARVELECDKLKRLNTDITYKLLEEQVAQDAEDVIFDMIKALVKRQERLTFDLYADLKERKESPIKILSVLYTSLKNIIIVQSYKQLKNQEISDKTGLSSAQVYFTRELIDKFSLERLRDHLIEVQQAEVDIKTGKIDQDVAMDAVILSILR